MDYVLVWRTKEGTPLSAYSGQEKGSIRVDSNPDMTIVATDTLRELVSSREPFEPVAVTLDDVRSVLGWDVPDPTPITTA